MQIVRSLAGFSMGRADEVRRAMSKKKAKEMQRARQCFIYGETDENGNVTVPGCVRNGIDEKIAESIFDDMDAFAQYAFNKSHAAAYSFVTYQTAYLKCLYPEIFMAALISSVMGDTNKVALYINNCMQNGIAVLPPDINKSSSDFIVEGKSIRYGLTTIKNVGENFTRSCVAEREKNGPYKSLRDFVMRMIGELNKRAVECLIKSGAFDSLPGTRSQKLAAYENIIDSESHAGKTNIAGQFSFFMADDDRKDVFDQKVPDLSQRELLNMEKESAGMYLSGHPLSEYREKIDKMGYAKCAELLAVRDEPSDKYYDGAKVVMAGIISARKDKLTRSNTNMAFLTVEDFTGGIEVIVFPKNLTTLDAVLAEDSIVAISGRLDVKDDENVKIILETAAPFTASCDCLEIELEGDSIYLLDKIRANVFRHKGNIPVQIKCDYGIIEANTAVNCDGSDSLVKKINEICGFEAAKIKK